MWVSGADVLNLLALREEVRRLIEKTVDLMYEEREKYEKSKNYRKTPTSPPSPLAHQ